jgi:hypothetical protein
VIFHSLRVRVEGKGGKEIERTKKGRGGMNKG